ncbi:MAG: FAD-binding protein [Xanthomonadales bacterium]|nr:FAD-binding protein [Xanthomonadales bacterium]NIN58673.1 FAD-binding protein [Xanthomonadales bacterium]NIN74523.1 FAD-binding protein [Xanthomonadales bacterium]NIO14828.1 FAD-binding protein [Xanthomonadales bacterium]NIP11066.1 FAD-binding protein [Xanthomonadales bacterium]
MGDRGNGLTRREVLKGAGAAVASMGVVSLAASRASAQGEWDHTTDILVVGSGVGACSAAVTAHDNGDAVLLIEKAEFLGGTSAKSAGVLWIPNNFTLKARGIEDGRADCLAYMARFSYPERFDPQAPAFGLEAHELALLEAFYDNASPAVDRLRASGALSVAEWRMFALDRPATDYLDNVPENKVPAGRPLGPVNAEGAMGLGAELMAQLTRAVQQRGVATLTGHRAARLVTDGERGVIGLEAETGGATVTIRARKAVIFATGGYVHDPGLTARHQRGRLYGSCAMPMAEGDFIRIAGAAGARMGKLGSAWRTQVLLEECLNSPMLAAGAFYIPGDSMLQVNKYGLRVVNEHRNYNDRTEVHSAYDASRAEYPNQVLFMIYDQRSAEGFAGAYPIPAKPGDAAHVLSGSTLEALTARVSERLEEIAASTGGLSLDPAFGANLKATIQRFNGFAIAGRDEDFQRGAAAYDNEWHPVFSPMAADSGWPANRYPALCMHPLRDEGPYYCTLLVAGALDTCGGPAIDASARVLDAGGKPIRGLYGAGNCIASPSGEAYYGAGHTLGMSLTFGYIAANAAHGEKLAET